MAKSGQTGFISPAQLNELMKDLEQLQSMDPGALVQSEAIEKMLPVIRGCRDRGHPWNRITQVLQKQLPGLTSATLRRVVFQLDPSLKGSKKGVKLEGKSESLIPEWDEDETDLESESEEYDFSDSPSSASSDVELEDWPPVKSKEE
jgi:hypothetical protein